MFYRVDANADSKLMRERITADNLIYGSLHPSLFSQLPSSPILIFSSSIIEHTEQYFASNELIFLVTR
jgi:hypothetical protein